MVARVDNYSSRQIGGVDVPHRVGRVLSFSFSSRRNWDSPNPSPAGECSGGGAHSLAREGFGESQFRRGDIHCGTLYTYFVIYLYFLLCCPFLLLFGERTRGRHFESELVSGHTVTPPCLHFYDIYRECKIIFILDLLLKNLTIAD